MARQLPPSVDVADVGSCNYQFLYVQLSFSSLAFSLMNSDFRSSARVKAAVALSHQLRSLALFSSSSILLCMSE